jgi:putative transposase
VAAVCRERGVSEQTYHRWRNQFGGLKADDAKRLKDLEQVRTWLRSDRALRTKPMAL